MSNNDSSLRGGGRGMFDSESSASEEHPRRRKLRRRGSSGSPPSSPLPDSVLDLTHDSPPPPQKRPAKKPPAKRKRKKKQASKKNDAAGSEAAGATAKQRRATINDWPGIAVVAAGANIRSVTTIDPGTRNLAVMRMEYAPAVRITHARVLDLELVCAGLDELEHTVRLNSANGGRAEYSIHTKLYALTRYVERESSNGGCFDSDMLLVEEQSFDRLMARVEATIVATFQRIKPPVVVLDGAEGGTWPAAQIITARSVKACYRPLFPLLKPGAEEPAGLRGGSRRSRPFGMGDVHGNRGSERQRQMHKRAAIKYGSLIIPQERFEAVVPAANFTENDRERLRRRKMDDLYDTLFMCLYFVSTYMFQAYKCRRRGTSRPMPAFETPPQRPRSCYEEIVEVCAALGTDVDDMRALLEALFGDAGRGIVSAAAQ